MKYLIWLGVLLMLPLWSVGQIKNPTTQKEETTLQSLDLPKKKPKAKKEVPSKKTSEQKVDNVLKGLLGKVPSKILKAKKIRFCEVESFQSEEKAAANIEGFKIVQSAPLTAEEMTSIKTILTSTSTYYLTEDMKQCLFLPKMGIQFIDKKDTVNVLVSFKCDLARFYNGRKKTTLDSDDGRDRLMAFFERKFNEIPPTGHEAMSLNITSKPIYYTVQEGDFWYNLLFKIENTYKTVISLDHLYQWNKEEQLKNAKDLPVGKTIIVGFEH